VPTIPSNWAVSIVSTVSRGCFRAPKGSRPRVRRRQVAVSTDPAAGAAAWRLTQLPSPDASLPTELDGVSCASSSLCATYASNHLFVSTDPAAARPAWLLSTLPFAPANRDGIACPEAYSCVIAGYDVSASSDLGNDPAVWTTPAPTPSVNVIGRGGEVTCVTATACVVFGDGELDVGTGTPAPAPSDAAITATLDGLLNRTDHS
jgi:hypothetical protein